MERVAIRFTNDLYVHVTIDNGDITLFTVDKQGNKTNYTVTKETTKSVKKSK